MFFYYVFIVYVNLEVLYLYFVVEQL